MAPRFGLSVALVVLAACATPKLHQAVEAKNLAEVNRLLDSGAPVDARDSKEDLTALGWAAANGSNEIAAALIAHRADVNARNRNGYTPIHAAAFWHRTEMVALLLSKGASPSAMTRDGQTPLHRALFRYGPLANPLRVVPLPELEAMMRTAELLIEGGADQNAAMATGDTPLHLAAMTGYTPLVELLVHRGAPVDARGVDDVTPLYLATTAGRLEVAKELIAHGARVDARTKSRYTPLTYAARGGSRNLVALLIEKGADVNARDVDGKTPLLWALDTASLASPAGNNLMMRLGVSPAERADFLRRLQTVERRWRDVAIDLIEHGADVRSHPPEGPSPLLLAAVTGDREVVDALLAHGAPIDEVTTGETALHGALAERQGEIVALLLEKGASVQVVNMSRRTPLHFAAWYLDDTSVVDALVARGADVNAKDVHGRTPLWYANDANHVRTAQALRSRGGK